jgi:hypothetical protein
VRGGRPLGLARHHPEERLHLPRHLRLQVKAVVEWKSMGTSWIGRERGRVANHFVGIRVEKANIRERCEMGGGPHAFHKNTREPSSLQAAWFWMTHA